MDQLLLSRMTDGRPEIFASIQGEGPSYCWVLDCGVLDCGDLEVIAECSGLSTHPLWRQASFESLSFLIAFWREGIREFVEQSKHPGAGEVSPDAGRRGAALDRLHRDLRDSYFFR